MSDVLRIKLKNFPNTFYKNEQDIDYYSGVMDVAYDKEYTDDASDNDKKNDEIDWIENKNININVNTRDKQHISAADACLQYRCRT